MRVSKLGIIAAMPEEFALLTERFSAHKVASIGPRDFFRATVHSRDLVLVCSRIGKVAAASTATTLIQSFGVDAVVVIGVAGGIGSHIRIGDVVVADTLIQFDMDLKGVLGCHRFDIPLLGVSSIKTSPELTRVATEAAHAVVLDAAYKDAVNALVLREPSVCAGTIASGDRFINERQEREELKALIPTLLAVEMEGAAVAQVCLEQGVPCAIARIISDSADVDAVVDFGTFIEKAAALGSDRFVAEFVGRLQ